MAGKNTAETHGKKNNRLVAAIDFGTTYSGYAFAFENELSGLQDPLKSVITNEWRSSRGVTTPYKAPTTVLFDPDRNFDSFGYEAENKYADLVEDEKVDHTKWYCFKKFKMKLYDQVRQTKLKRKFVIQDENGHEMPVKKIFAESIKFLKEDLKKTLDGRNPGFGDPNIWVLTVPAIWDEPAKQFMRESAEEIERHVRLIDGRHLHLAPPVILPTDHFGQDISKTIGDILVAGIKNQMILALEPESAAVYCKTLPFGSFYGTSDKELEDCFSPGGIYMVLDLGGGTVDTAVHGVRDDCSIKEVHKACGGAWGGTKVDEEFLGHIKKLFGENVVPDFQKEWASEWLEFVKSFEDIKKKVTYTGERNVKLPMPRKLEFVSKKFATVSALTTYKTNLIIKDNDLKSFFRPSAEKIEAHIRGILKKFPKLRMIYMVGGFSESEYIQKFLREKFPERRIIVPFNAGMAVLKGAVIIGIDELLKETRSDLTHPFQVTERICQWTYGVRAVVPFIEGCHFEDHSGFINGIKYCCDIFHTLVKEGDSVAMFDERSSEMGSNHEQETRRHIELQLAVFASRGCIPTYTTDANCRYLGKIILTPPEAGWPVRTRFSVMMFFGKSEFSVKVRDLVDDNKEPCICTFDFLE